MRAFSHLIIALSAALTMSAPAAASCQFSTAGHSWDMFIYGQTDCGTGNRFEEFFGTISGGCFDIAAALNDNVKSFVFTASDAWTINIFQDANCQGNNLGNSVGSWIDSSVSANGQQMSSFSIS